ncbi:uncharacterized protein OCT59_009126 [Rhizophagus irregularis]|uniref:uncharacterized protein n=1 Tax=Rhizophagus irregularis TaxID=588596 RepID=UPI001C150AB9|nr:hypothetical protein OCT59_009126 [Rhizophagus irregularis]CAB4475115.1 unnamed protein product [Rhizophagus irregularis]CAB5184855.1 unnamed protein product [Rhizophagus irregularis]
MDLEGKFNDDVFRLGKTNRSSWGNKVGFETHITKLSIAEILDCRDFVVDLVLVVQVTVEILIGYQCCAPNLNMPQIDDNHR